MPRRTKKLRAEIEGLMKRHRRSTDSGEDSRHPESDHELERHLKAQSLAQFDRMIEQGQESGLSSEEEDAWFSGELVEGVNFHLNEPVHVLKGAKAGELGSVVALLRLEPEPLYTVELSDGEDIHVFQSSITGAT